MGKSKCPACSTKGHRRDRQQRGTAAERGYGSKWQAARASWLADHPLCVLCLDGTPSIVTAASVVDHITAHKGEQKLFWDRKNWRSVCKPHHDARTDEGDFGRSIT